MRSAKLWSRSIASVGWQPDCDFTAPTRASSYSRAPFELVAWSECAHVLFSTGAPLKVASLLGIRRFQKSGSKWSRFSNDHERRPLINSRMWTDRPTGYVREKRSEVNVETERPHGADPKRLRPPDDRIFTDEILQWVYFYCFLRLITSGFAEIALNRYSTQWQLLW